MQVYSPDMKAQPILRLIPGRAGMVELVAVDVHGEVLPSGYIAEISSEGIYLQSGLEAPGFAVDARGCIRILESNF